MFSGLAKLTLNTAELSEPELERILLSANAKKFAIAREIIYANRFFKAQMYLFTHRPS
jgi:hypothetical protein